MLILKNIYIPNNTVSNLAFIRNITIIFVVYLVFYEKYSPIYFLIPIILYIFFDILDTYGYSIDNSSLKIVNCYDGVEVITTTSELFNKEFKEYRKKNLSDYTEGKYDGNTNKSWSKAKKDQFDWILKNAKCSKGKKILEIGSGTCTLLMEIKKRGAIPFGITLSKEQSDICRKKGIHVRVLNMKDLGKIPEWENYFDAVICNGPLEHLSNLYEYNNNLQDKTYLELFKNINYVLKPKGRVVITCLHLKKHIKDWTYKQFYYGYLVERGYGGMYPVTKHGLVKNSKKYFNLLINEDHTLDYYITWTKWYKNVSKVSKHFIPGFIVYLPYLIVNDPYFIQSYFLSLYPESSFQVHLNPNDDRGLVTHRWIVLDKK
tara:strand:+ start:122 stop:1243 length:1122 start_codon:yes stop_codon:yes gene_type:complete